MIRIAREAMTTATTTITTTTITATTLGSSPGWLTSWHHERGRPTDLDHLDLLPCVDFLAVVVRARGPHLAPDLHGADSLAVRDPLEHHGVLSDQRRGARSKRRPRAAMTDRDRAQQRQEGDSRRRERDRCDQPAGARSRERRR